MCVFTAYGVQCLVAGCRGLGAGQQAGARLRRATSLFLDVQPAVLYLTPDNQQPSTAHHRR